MANNCMNYINITGSKNDVQELSKLLELGEKQQNGYDIYANLCNEFGKSENDGRWFDIEVTNSEDDCITISGDSAWSPCLELFTKISKKYASLEIHYEYEESGFDFAGWADISEGNCNDNCFGYWEGRAKTDYNYAFQSAFEEVVCYVENDTDEEEFKTCDLYNAFNPEEQKELLEEFLTKKYEHRKQ